MNQFNEHCKQINGQQMEIIQNYYQLLVLKQKDKIEKVEIDENKNNEIIQDRQQEQQMNNKSKNIQENNLVYNSYSDEIETEDSQAIYDCQFCPKLFKNNVNLYWHTCQKHQQENQ